jgi:hypothetical protein
MINRQDREPGEHTAHRSTAYLIMMRHAARVQLAGELLWYRKRPELKG